MDIKKAGVTFYLNVAACVLALAGWIIFLVTNSTNGYAVTNGTIAIALGIIGVLLIAVGTFASIKFGPQHFITAVIKFVALVCLMVMLGLLLASRAEIAANVYTFEHDNPVAMGVMNISIACGVITLISVILLIVTAFMDKKKA